VNGLKILSSTRLLVQTNVPARVAGFASLQQRCAPYSERPRTGGGGGYGWRLAVHCRDSGGGMEQR
jgi:hypothetical protein